MDEERLRKAIELAKVATEKDAAGDYEEAFQYYKSSLDHWQLICKSLKMKLYEKMEPYVERAEMIKEYLAKQKADKVPVISPSNDTAPSANSTQDALKDGFQGLFTQERPTIKWSDVAGLEAAKASLQEAVILPSRFPELFTGKRQPWKGILLFGPPGTGKTHLARACATETSASFLAISSADLISKWQGESEKLVRALFEVAAKNAPTIIFIDEVDSLCGARNDRESESSKRVKTEFLVQMEGLSSKPNSRVLVLGATNEPWALDSAIRRRFERRIYIPLPDFRARKELIRIHLGDTPSEMTSEDFDEIAAQTEGYSGADVSVLVRNALLGPLRQCQNATHFKQVLKNNDAYWVACAPNDPDPTKTEMTIMEVPSAKLLPRDVCMVRFLIAHAETLGSIQNDFRDALLSVKPTLAASELFRFEAWTKQFGIEGQ